MNRNQLLTVITTSRRIDCRPVLVIVGFIVSLVLAGCSSTLASAPSATLSVPTPWATTAAATTSTTRVPNSLGYPRIVQLGHQTGSYATWNGYLLVSSDENIVRSTTRYRNAGAPDWEAAPIGSIPKPPGSLTSSCCQELYEMPADVGSLTAGTLLFARTDQNSTKTQIDLYLSHDAGATWTMYGTPVVGGPKGQGVWEPEFTIGKPDLGTGQKALIMYYSDETQSGSTPANHGCKPDTASVRHYCQKLSEIRTFDGSTWSVPNAVSASSNAFLRPGMARVSILPDGSYFLTSEVCGTPVGLCEAHYKLSPDGWTWQASSIGTPVQLPDGRFLDAAPTNAWIASPLSPKTGAVIVAAQALYDKPPSSGKATPSSSSGREVFETLDPESVDPNGIPNATWFAIPAPVQVRHSDQPPAGIPSFCLDYSSSLLSAADGRSILEVSGDVRRGTTDGVKYNDKHCTVYSGFEKLPTSTSSTGPAGPRPSSGRSPH